MTTQDTKGHPREKPEKQSNTDQKSIKNSEGYPTSYFLITIPL